MATLAALLLADSRLPTGGHVHSGGVEAAVARGLVRDEADLALFLAGRLRGTGLMIAAAAAAGCLLANTAPVNWSSWDSAVSARIPSLAAREASRGQGATMLRTARRIWPCAALDALGTIGRPHHPLVLGAAVAASGNGPEVAASLAVHHLLGGASTAAVRLLGLDPISVAAVQARLCPAAERIVVTATGAAREASAQQDSRLLPSPGTPLPEVLAELHANTEVTLFAS